MSAGTASPSRYGIEEWRLLTREPVTTEQLLRALTGLPHEMASGLLTPCGPLFARRLAVLAPCPVVVVAGAAWPAILSPVTG